MMIGAGDARSRGDVRKFQGKEDVAAAKSTAAGAALGCRREMVDLLKSPPQDAQQAKMVAAVNISHLLERKQARDNRRQEVLNLQGEINTFVSLGEHEEAATAKRRLLALYRSPVTVPALPTPTDPIAEPAAGTPALHVSGISYPLSNGNGVNGARAETPALDVSGINYLCPTAPETLALRRIHLPWTSLASTTLCPTAPEALALRRRHLPWTFVASTTLCPTAPVALALLRTHLP